VINFDSDGLVDGSPITTLPAPRHHYRATPCWQGHSGEMPVFTPAELEIIPVTWADVPLDTWAGRVWMRPTTRKKTKNNDCDQCLLIDLCREQVGAGGYCGCEGVLAGEVML